MQPAYRVAITKAKQLCHQDVLRSRLGDGRAIIIPASLAARGIANIASLMLAWHVPVSLKPAATTPASPKASTAVEPTASPATIALVLVLLPVHL